VDGAGDPEIGAIKARILDAMMARARFPSTGRAIRRLETARDSVLDYVRYEPFLPLAQQQIQDQDAVVCMAERLIEYLRDHSIFRPIDTVAVIALCETEYDARAVVFGMYNFNFVDAVHGDGMITRHWTDECAEWHEIPSETTEWGVELPPYDEPLIVRIHDLLDWTGDVR
jgi:hypothetical protein